MQCSQCGEDPAIVIADGISVSFSWHRVESLRPPTVSDKLKALARLPWQGTKATCFIGPHKMRIVIQKALDEEDVKVGKSKLQSILKNKVIPIPLIVSNKGLTGSYCSVGCGY